MKIAEKTIKATVIDEILDRKIPDERHREIDQQIEILLNRHFCARLSVT